MKFVEEKYYPRRSSMRHTQLSPKQRRSFTAVRKRQVNDYVKIITLVDELVEVNNG